MHGAPWELFDAKTYATYLAAAAALVAAPGPGQALVVARTLHGGARAGLLTSVGLNLGTLGHTVAAALGLSALLLASATAFTVVKLVGAAYLLVLGARMLLATLRRTPVAVPSRGEPEPRPVDSSSLLAHGVLTGLLNPKVALFFLAFLPQFVRPERGWVFLQFTVLGATLALLGVVGDCAVALLAARTGRRLLGGTWRERITGGVLVALGVRLALVRR
jgi:threonine/homoserine/homoserine lactone efflux protein